MTIEHRLVGKSAGLADDMPELNDRLKALAAEYLAEWIKITGSAFPELNAEELARNSRANAAVQMNRVIICAFNDMMGDVGIYNARMTAGMILGWSMAEASCCPVHFQQAAMDAISEAFNYGHNLQKEAAAAALSEMKADGTLAAMEAMGPHKGCA